MTEIKTVNNHPKMDPEFRSLLALDPAFEEWRSYASEWVNVSTKDNLGKIGALVKFFTQYINGQKLRKSPISVLEEGFVLPSLWEILSLDSYKSARGKEVNDRIYDFVDWVLKEKFSVVDDTGLHIIPTNLRNPFTRLSAKKHGMCSDMDFYYILKKDRRMEDWRALASEWFAKELYCRDKKKNAINLFFNKYLAMHENYMHPAKLFLADLLNMEIIGAIISARNGNNGKYEVSMLTPDYIMINNHLHQFMSWIMLEKLDGNDIDGNIKMELKNPVPLLRKSGFGISETVKSPLSYRYIRELRELLVQGKTFSDWAWVQNIMSNSAASASWFTVDKSIIDHGDPDCVWRQRSATKLEKRKDSSLTVVFDLWSPVIAVALYLKLELPLRTFQVRMLDSGEADTWRYIAGTWQINESPMKIGNEKRPSQRGVFLKTTNESGSGFHINTNKTGDINKAEADKGYDIPWTHQSALYWLEKLRNWQEKYNPILTPTPWINLDARDFGRTPPHPVLLKQRGSVCFLFRHAAASNITKRDKPVTDDNLSRMWYLLLAELERKCIDRGETLDNGAPIRFVKPDGQGTYFPLHALRVSLITAYALNGGVPFPILSKLIAGHARLIMTLYYTKAGKQHVTEVMQNAEKKMIENEAVSQRRFLMEKSYHDIEKHFAYNSVDGLNAITQKKSEASLCFEDKGICPVAGGLCEIGGEEIGYKEDGQKKYFAPVSGYPHECNCVRCRFFLTGPAFLPGLQAHVNFISYKIAECSERYTKLEQQVCTYEDERLDCEERGEMFTKNKEFETINRHYEAEAKKANKLLLDLQAGVRLMDRCIAIANSATGDGMTVVASGGISDVGYAFAESTSEMYQLEVICENAVIYPEIDAGKATLSRSQVLDAMLQANGRPPVFFRMSAEQQLLVGNALMKMIQARTDSLKDAVEFAEGKRLLADLGLLDQATVLLEEKTQGMSYGQIVNTAQAGPSMSRKALAKGV
jgi:hypothetical protein